MYKNCFVPIYRLTLLVGKYESNATALSVALSYSDRAMEAYDILVTLLESEISLALSNNERNLENRRVAENLALHVLRKLDSDQVLSKDDSIILPNE